MLPVKRQNFPVKMADAYQNHGNVIQKMTVEMVLMKGISAVSSFQAFKIIDSTIHHVLEFDMKLEEKYLILSL